MLAIHRAGHAIDIGFVGIRAEDLQFIAIHEEQTTVAAMLALALASLGHHPLNVNLARAVRVLGLDAARAGSGLEVTILHCPFRVAPVARPLRQIFAVKEHDRITRRSAAVGGAGARSHARGLRTLEVVHAPLLSCSWSCVLRKRCSGK